MVGMHKYGQLAATPAVLMRARYLYSQLRFGNRAPTLHLSRQLPFKINAPIFALSHRIDLAEEHDIYL